VIAINGDAGDPVVEGVLAVGRRDRGPPFAYGAEPASLQGVALPATISANVERGL